MWLTYPAAGDHWPGFRGPRGDGLSLERGLPSEWSSETNVKWVVDLPMEGNSSPVVWGDRVFLTGAVENGAERLLMCFDRGTGEMLWHNAIRSVDAEPTHKTNPYCSSTPVTDGRRVFVWLGSAGVAAFDFEGNGLWKRDIGVHEFIWGNAASPVLFEDLVILNAGPGPRSQLIALSQTTGEVVYERFFPEASPDAEVEWRGSWSTPVLTETDGAAELILSLPHYVAGFSPKTGRELWRVRGLTDLVYTSPVVGREVIVAMSGYGGATIGFRRPGLSDRGDLTESHRLWRVEKNPQRIGSGVILGEHLYIVNEPGIAECLVAATGETVWKQRLGTRTWGSTIYADAKLFVTDDTGATHLFAASPTFTLLGRNALADVEITRATPAYSDGQVIIRTYDRLYCIEDLAK